MSSNDPFAMPEQTATTPTSRRQSMAANGGQSPGAGNKISLVVPSGGGHVHGRTVSSDPMGLESPVHVRQVSSDPTVVESPHGSNSNASGDFSTVAEPTPKKKGWSLFKSKDEKDLEEFEVKQQGDARKAVEADQEKEVKDIKAEYATVKKHFDTVHKEYKKMQEKLEEEYNKIRSDFKKERKTEIEGINKTHVEEHKIVRKLVKQNAVDKKLANEKTAKEEGAAVTPDKSENVEENREAVTAEEKKEDE